MGSSLPLKAFGFSIHLPFNIFQPFILTFGVIYSYSITSSENFKVNLLIVNFFIQLNGNVIGGEQGGNIRYEV